METKQGKCRVCGKETTELNKFADGTNEEGLPDTYKDYCHNECYEELLNKSY